MDLTYSVFRKWLVSGSGDNPDNESFHYNFWNYWLALIHVILGIFVLGRHV